MGKFAMGHVFKSSWVGISTDPHIPHTKWYGSCEINLIMDTTLIRGRVRLL